MVTNRIRNAFDGVAEWTARNLGSPVSFTLALMIVITWAVSGPLFAFSDTWQLIINTGTTIATFLMVFLLQNSSNRNSDELHTIIRDMRDANCQLLERLSAIEKHFNDEQ